MKSSNQKLNLNLRGLRWLWWNFRHANEMIRWQSYDSDIKKIKFCLKVIHKLFLTGTLRNVSRSSDFIFVLCPKLSRVRCYCQQSDNIELCEKYPDEHCDGPSPIMLRLTFGLWKLKDSPNMADIRFACFAGVDVWTAFRFWPTFFSSWRTNSWPISSNFSWCRVFDFSRTLMLLMSTGLSIVLSP